MSISFPVQIKTAKVSSSNHINVYYPQVMNMDNQSLEDLINRSIIIQTQLLIDEQVGNMPTTVEEMLGSYEIKNNQRQVLSVSLSNYTYHHHAAHGMTYIKSLTFDLEKETQVELKDLFLPESDYMRRLSELIQAQIKQRDIPLLYDFSTIRQDQDFYIADKTVVIYFQLYEMSPYAYGFPMFPISVYDLADIIVEDGPLGRLATHS